MLRWPADVWANETLQAVAVYAVIILLVVAALGLWWWFPKWQIRRYAIRDVAARGNLEDNFRKTIGQLIGGVGLLAGLFFTFAQFQQSQNNSLRQEMQAQNIRQLQLRDQVNKQFSDGVAQLGSEKLAVRIGGIINLERVIELSEALYPMNNPYRTRVIQLLASFSRTSGRDAHTQQIASSPDYVPLDNEIAVTVILRHLAPARPNVVERLILTGVILTNTNFEEFRSARIDFTEAKFGKAILPRADFSNSKMDRADLTGVVINKGDLSGARLRRAKLASAQLLESNLSGADFADADLAGANLSSSDFTGVNFVNARIEGALLTDTEGLVAAVVEQACGTPRSPLPRQLAAVSFRPCPPGWPNIPQQGN